MKSISILVCLTNFSVALRTINMQPEPPATANGSCRMSRDIVWLRVTLSESDFYLTVAT